MDQLFITRLIHKTKHVWLCNLVISLTSWAEHP